MPVKTLKPSYARDHDCVSAILMYFVYFFLKQTQFGLEIL
ncbi:hypothetical protein HAL07_03810 [Helicobacter ailurogastricus]|uniref:Uncharacterized protein n=1 Tax=Helicobacter ailurogastricus TaxID=1578720 RepID=A0A0K2Y546_9HELI|nr:hypothetical protein HAL07_03810 [Helicobacter ailurogastricus]